MQPQEPRFTLAELVEASGLPERTIRYYITEGLVSPANGRGRSRYFTPRHLQELTLVTQLREQRLSIDEIRERLSQPPEPPAPDYETWQRFHLHPDLELLVRSDAPESVHALVREITLLARGWFGNDEER